MDAQEFDHYGIGRDVFTRNLQGEEICDMLRFFVEECDRIQGLHFILENIANEYTNTPMLLYVVKGPGSHMNLRSRKQTVVRDLHDAVLFSRLSFLRKMILRVGLPFLSMSKSSTILNIKDENPYHYNAIMEPLGSTADSSDASGVVGANGIVQMLAGQSRQKMVTILDVAMSGFSLIRIHNEQPLLGKLQPLTSEIAEDVDDLPAVESMIV
ncbi:hypothetical protein REPUB_Repub11eG0081000 [Reevesia pubescens]